jgi:hypothetical protein
MGGYTPRRVTSARSNRRELNQVSATVRGKWRSTPGYAGLSVYLPNAGDDLVDLGNLPTGECEPLNAANAVGLSARLERSVLPQQDCDAVALRDHAFNCGLLVLHFCEIFPRRCDDGASARQVPFMGPNPQMFNSTSSDTDSPNRSKSPRIMAS